MTEQLWYGLGAEFGWRIARDIFSDDDDDEESYVIGRVVDMTDWNDGITPVLCCKNRRVFTFHVKLAADLWSLDCSVFETFDEAKKALLEVVSQMLENDRRIIESRNKVV